MFRRWVAGVAAVTALIALACDAENQPEPDEPAPPPGDLPASMAALGDSITAGFGACLLLTACRRNSWSSGDGLRVESHYRRIAEANPAMRGNALNHAVSGARVSGLADQASAAVESDVHYITILIGANDACRADVGDMTSVPDFRAGVDRALSIIGSGLPEARVLVASIPDLYRLWEIGHGNDRVVRAWNRGVCPSMLADASSTEDADVSRRSAVRDRVAAYNGELAAACREHGSRCRYDGGAVHEARFTLDMLNTLDYFHPDADGQEHLAEVTYAVSGLAT